MPFRNGATHTIMQWRTHHMLGFKEQKDNENDFPNIVMLHAVCAHSNHCGTSPSTMNINDAQVDIPDAAAIKEIQNLASERTEKSMVACCSPTFFRRLRKAQSIWSQRGSSGIPPGSYILKVNVTRNLVLCRRLYGCAAVCSAKLRMFFPRHGNGVLTCSV